MAKIDPYERFSKLNVDHCWQYEVRLQNLKDDLLEANLTEDDIEGIKVSDFSFSYVDKSDKGACDSVRSFIEKHEFLGNLPNRPTHRFVARYKKNDMICGAIIMATPNAFSNILGKDNRNLEKLISRGACISWGPKNLGSWLIMQSIKWMIKNTEFRVFTAYSDPEAYELGTIYQALNFTYLGQSNGVIKQYRDPENLAKGWFSDRNFRHNSHYRVYAEKVGISKEQWKKWTKKYSPNWEIIPVGVKKKVKEQERLYRESCEFRVVKPKHKYCYILGENKRETKRLRGLFEENNPKLIGLPYPKNRGA